MRNPDGHNRCFLIIKVVVVNVAFIEHVFLVESKVCVLRCCCGGALVCFVIGNVTVANVLEVSTIEMLLW